MGLINKQQTTGSNMTRPAVKTTTLPLNKAKTERLEKTLPQGWDVERVNRLLKNYSPLIHNEFNHYQDENESHVRMNVMKIPVELVPAVRELIAKHGRCDS